MVELLKTLMIASASLDGARPWQAKWKASFVLSAGAGSLQYVHTRVDSGLIQELFLF